MAHRVAPRAELDLDDIWYYVAKESGSIETANRLVDGITDRFYVLARHPFMGRSRDEDFGAHVRRARRARQSPPVKDPIRRTLGVQLKKRQSCSAMHKTN